MKESKSVFVGPSDEPWWKFKLAKIGWKLTRGNPISSVGYIPGANRLARWSFEVLVMSRDFEVQEEKST